MLVVPTELRPSPIHGVGVFLLVPVKKGDLIWRFDSRIDRVYTESELESLPESVRDFIKIRAPWHEKTKLYALCGDNAKYINHSYTPNTWADGDTFSELFAAEDIESGREITENYHCCYDNAALLEHMKLR